MATTHPTATEGATAAWRWDRQPGPERLICELLAPWKHGFFTRQAGPQTPETLTAALALGATAHRVKQVHGNRVLSPGDGLGTAEARAEADGLISDRPHQALWVCSADCSPVLVGDRATGRVAAIHAGWRGTAQAIVPGAVGQLLAAGSRVEDLAVAIGPAIAGAVYQVSIDVAAAVGRTLLKAPPEDDDAVINRLMGQPHGPMLCDETPGKVRLDVRLANALQLERLGLSPEQITIAPHCTFQEPERFFSYRRTGEKQVQWSGIVSREL